MVERSPMLQPTKQREVLTIARRQVWRHFQKETPRTDDSGLRVVWNCLRKNKLLHELVGKQVALRFDKFEHRTVDP